MTQTKQNGAQELKHETVIKKGTKIRFLKEAVYFFSHLNKDINVERS